MSGARRSSYRILSIYLPESLDDLDIRIGEHADRLGMSTSELIRVILLDFLAEHDGGDDGLTVEEGGKQPK